MPASWNLTSPVISGHKKRNFKGTRRIYFGRLIRLRSRLFLIKAPYNRRSIRQKHHAISVRRRNGNLISELRSLNSVHYRETLATAPMLSGRKLLIPFPWIIERSKVLTSWLKLRNIDRAGDNNVGDQHVANDNGGPGLFPPVAHLKHRRKPEKIRNSLERPSLFLPRCPYCRYFRISFLSVTTLSRSSEKMFRKITMFCVNDFYLSRIVINDLSPKLTRQARLCPIQTMSTMTFNLGRFSCRTVGLRNWLSVCT